MSRQYNNFKKKLQEYNAELLTTVDEYIHDKETKKYPELEIKCQRNHVFTVKTTSLQNKLYKLKKSGGGICAECEKPEISGEEQKAREKCEELGFGFVSFKDRQVEYICVCGNQTSTHAPNLTRGYRKAQCVKCQNDKNRTPEEDVKKVFEDAGCELLSKYTNRNKPVDYKCSCGTKAKIRYADFVKGKRCNEVCKSQKYKETCDAQYGVKNMFQLESVKEKSRKTCLEKYGVEHCMQNKEIQSKAKLSSFHLKKTVEKGKYKWVVQGYEPFCIQDLLKEKNHPKNIDTENVPSFKYIFGGKTKVWHPDVYLHNKKRIIEVKSTFTYNVHAKQMRAKMRQCPIDCELRIYNRDGTLFEKVIKHSTCRFFTYEFGEKFEMGQKIPV